MLEVEAGGGLVEDVEGGSGRPPPQLEANGPLRPPPDSVVAGFPTNVGEADVVIWRMRAIFG